MIPLESEMRRPRNWSWQIRRAKCVLLGPDGHEFASVKRKTPLLAALNAASIPVWGAMDRSMECWEGQAAWIVAWLQSARISEALTAARRS